MTLPPDANAAADVVVADVTDWSGPGAPSSAAAVDALLDRIARLNPALHAVLETDESGARAQAALRDAETAAGYRRGPLHGVPFLVKGNIDVGPTSPLRTTAGSAALAGSAPPAADAPALARIRAAGGVLIGSANLSEWANFRSTGSSSGWSALGGQCRNPHGPDYSPGGSSAGSGAAVAARLAPFALGTETNGSILCPASLNGVVGVKPTLGLVPGQGVVPIAGSQDVIGPLARTVADAALVWSVLAGREPVTLSPRALDGARIGIPRAVYCGYDAAADAALEAALGVLSRLGAVIIDPADISTAAALRDEPHEMTLLLCEFRDDLAAYLTSRPGGPAGLADIIAFNLEHAELELAFFDQDLLERSAASGGRNDPAYAPARAACLRLARTEGIDATLARHQLDALLMPSYPAAWPIRLGSGGDGNIAGSGAAPTAIAGYPAVTVPAGMSPQGLPLGVMFAGTAGTDARLLGYAYAFEQATHHLVDPMV
jgi:amidase